MERARTEMLRSLGIEQDELREREGVVFAVRSIQVDYVKPAKFNDSLQVITTIASKGKASLHFAHEVRRENDQQLLCTGQARIACVNSASLRPAPIPESLNLEINRAG
jgi:acyl-CoA thioester hydrolase